VNSPHNGRVLSKKKYQSAKFHYSELGEQARTKIQSGLKLEEKIAYDTAYIECMLNSGYEP
jgi:hypothetical protein